MFRARVAAQGFTVIAMVAGSMYYSKDREKSKELRKLKEERDAEEKRQRWIRELEARDDEDKAIKARLRKGRGFPEGPDAAAADAKTESQGGILGKMGLWADGEKKAAEEKAIADAAATAATETSPKKENPNSSLGALGEIMQKKKGDGESKS